MGFVSEEIRSEVDKEYYYYFNPTNILGKRMDAYWWAIDRESGNFLYMRCASNPAWDTNSCFGLFVDREQILLEAVEESEGKLSQNNVIQTWRIKRIKVPQVLLDKGYTLEQIENLIRESFDALGYIGFERSKIKEVYVYIDTAIEII